MDTYNPHSSPDRALLTEGSANSNYMQPSFDSSIPKVIKSIANNDQDILLGIMKLYNNNEPFDLDPAYSKGGMYEGIPQPKIKMDLDPQSQDIKQNDILNGIPLESNSIKSVVFDPPFMFGKHGKTDQYVMTKRFTMFDSWADLEKLYKKALQEFYRILVKNGIAAFKCQDYTDSKTTLTHCFVFNWATEIGFTAEDIFILNFEKGRIYNSLLTQRHARKFHCYWLVFKK